MTPSQSAALSRLARMTDEELLEEARKEGLDVRGLVERQREWVKRKVESCRRENAK